MYAAVKHLHMTFAALSFIGFFIRGIWMLTNSGMLQKKWVKIAPHIIDTLLLLTAFTLIYYIGFASWVGAKIIGLVFYIGLGVIALRPHFPKPFRISAWLSAMVVFFYIASVAISKNPLPWVH